jgi:hypothetical protein
MKTSRGMVHIGGAVRVEFPRGNGRFFGDEEIEKGVEVRRWKDL